METSLAVQALGLGLALLLGVGLGLAYDLLRPPRRRLGPIPAVLLDLLFSLCAGTAAFLYAMGAGRTAGPLGAGGGAAGLSVLSACAEPGGAAAAGAALSGDGKIMRLFKKILKKT